MLATGSRVRGEASAGSSWGASLVRPAVLLRAEGAVVLGLSVLLYGMNGGEWGIFALALLAPDLSALGYLVGRRVGSVTYNVSHAYPVPAALAVAGLLSGNPVVLGAGLVWFAHIGMDRLIGYGLKYPESLKDTHLGRV